MSVASAFEYCATRVRQLDYENYLCALFLPREHRPAALALRAFNAETASALGATKEPQLALMRLKWWRDAVDAAHDADADLPDHPVAIALRAVLATQTSGSTGGARTKAWLRRIADARVRDAEMGLENQTPGSVAFLEAYAESTSSSVLYLQLDLGGLRDTSADHAASHLGKALGMVNLLRGTPAHAKQRRCYLPLDVCAKHGAVAEDVYRGKTTEAIKDAAHEVASVAKAHLDSARGMASTLRGLANANANEPETDHDGERKRALLDARKAGDGFFAGDRGFDVPGKAGEGGFRRVPPFADAAAAAARRAGEDRVGGVHGEVLAPS